MNRRMVSWVSASALAVAALAAYVVPAASQDSAQRVLDLRGYPQKVYQGEESLSDHLFFEAPIPAELRSRAVEFDIGLYWGIERIGNNARNKLKLDFTARVGDASDKFLTITVDLTVKAFSHTTRAANLIERCPCDALVVSMAVDMSLARSGGEYAFRLVPPVLKLWWEPIDSDHDGIVQEAQWVGHVPQYAWALALLVPAAATAALLAIQRPTQAKAAATTSSQNAADAMPTPPGRRKGKS